MIHFEKAYVGYQRSWRTWLASLVITSALFGALSITRIGETEVSEPETPAFRFYIPPPPETETSNQVPLPSEMEPTFRFAVEESQPIEDIPLDFIHVPLGPSLNPVASVDLDLKSRLLADRPEVKAGITVYERGEVDRSVVPLYIPRSNLPYRLQGEGGEVYVLYRVTDRGRTENIHILSTTNPELNPYSERLIRRVRFRPAEKNGNPVSIWVQHALRFQKGSSSPFTL